MDNTLERLQILEDRVQELAEDLRELKQFAAVDLSAGLHKIRYITERVLTELADSRTFRLEAKDRSLDRMCADLAKAGILPKAMELHVRTIQTNTNPGSHYQAESLDQSHLMASQVALVALLEWHYRHKLPRRTWRDRWWKILVGLLVTGGIVFLAVKEYQNATAGDEWTYRTITHERLGYAFEVPAHFTESAPGPGNRTFRDGKAELIVVGRPLEAGASKDDICKQVRSLEGTAGVLTTYSKTGSSGCVSSGYVGTQTFYQRAFWTDDATVYLVVRYPTDGKSAYDAMITHVVKSMKWTR